MAYIEPGTYYGMPPLGFYGSAHAQKCPNCGYCPCCGQAPPPSDENDDEQEKR